MQEIHKLRAQITNIVQGNYPGLDIQFDPKLLPPNEVQVSNTRFKEVLTEGLLANNSPLSALIAQSH